MLNNIRAKGLGLRALMLLAFTLMTARANAQAVGGADKARPVAGDPGISSMAVMDQPNSACCATMRSGCDAPHAFARRRDVARCSRW
jgi:hypothetical protein